MSNKLSLIKSKITLTRGLNKDKIINNILWFISWVIVYHISMAIGAELIFIPMLLNLPLATFFCLGVILQLLSVSILLYPPEYDWIAKLLGWVFTFILYGGYRHIFHPDSPNWKERIISRLWESLFWVFPWLITMTTLGYMLNFL